MSLTEQVTNLFEREIKNNPLTCLEVIRGFLKENCNNGKIGDPFNILDGEEVNWEGINAYIRVRLNGVLTDLQKPVSIRQAITQANGDPATALVKLKVRKLHDGALYPVQWPAGTDAILSLPLEGGEEIEW